MAFLLRSYAHNLKSVVLNAGHSRSPAAKLSLKYLLQRTALNEVVGHSSSLLASIPLCEYSSLSLHSSADAQRVAIWGLLRVVISLSFEKVFGKASQ